jgi:hypothetical protein
MLTDERLAEIEARCNAATPGPWDAKVSDAGVRRDVGIIAMIHGGRHVLAEVYDQVDAQGADAERCWRDGCFIAAARADVPDLLAEVKRMRAEMARDYPTIESDEVLHFEPVSRYIVLGRVASVTWGEMRWVEEEESDGTGE